jgi:hypothetical protein
MKLPDGILPVFALLSFGLCSLSSPGSVRAEPLAPDKGHAQMLRDRARLAIETDELPEAHAALLALQALDPSIDTACNLGLVARRLQRWVEAAENLNRCVRAYTAVPVEPVERARYDELVGELLMARAAVTSVVLTAPRGAPVTVDERPIGAASSHREYFVEPGWHVFGVGDERQRIHFKAGARLALKFGVSAKSPSGARDPVLVGGIVGTIAAAVTGGALITASHVKRGDAEGARGEALDTSRSCALAHRDQAQCDGIKGAKDMAGDLQTAAIVSFIGAGALGAATTFYWSVKPSSPRVVVGASSIQVVVQW